MSESKSLHDKVILVTGASQGIGAATASVLGREGVRLSAQHRGAQTDLDGAMSTLAGIEASRKQFVAGDFENKAVPDRVWSQALDACGHHDVLVLNAAMMVPADDVEDSGDAWDTAWNRHYGANGATYIR